jgi:hypothetical protein
VTEYVQLYLGDTARAASFANELIRLKRTNPGIVAGGGGGGDGFSQRSGGWEGASGGKKSKKKGKK